VTSTVSIQVQHYTNIVHKWM